MDSLVQTVCVFTEDRGMEFGIEKCVMVVMEKGKNVKSVCRELPNGKVMKSLQDGYSYKYLGILEADKFLEEKMKSNVSKELIPGIPFAELIPGQYPYLDIQQHLLVGGKVNCRLQIEKLGSCLTYMENYTISQM